MSKPGVTKTDKVLPPKFILFFDLAAKGKPVGRVFWEETASKILQARRWVAADLQVERFRLPQIVHLTLITYF